MDAQSDTSPRILIVENDTNFRHALKDLLQLDNYIVVMATDGQNALDYLQNANFLSDLIISARTMPYLDGVRFFKRVCANQRWGHIPFALMVVAGCDPDNYAEVIGVDLLFTKPMNADDFLNAVKKTLGDAHNREGSDR